MDREGTEWFVHWLIGFIDVQKTTQSNGDAVHRELHEENFLHKEYSLRVKKIYSKYQKPVKKGKKHNHFGMT